MNVLIPNVGRRGYLVQYLKRTESFKGNVYVSDCDNTASGLYGGNDGAYILPRPSDNESNYIECLRSLCKQNKIKVIIPVIDPEIVILSRYKDFFQKEGCFVAVSTEEVLEICYNKLYMNDFLVANGFEVPKTYGNIDGFERDYINGDIDFPAIVKPIYGSGSVATYRVDNEKELRALYKSNMIIQRFVEGQEYGVDIFNDLNGEPVRCVLKRKISMRSGETDKSESVINKSIEELMCSMGRKLGHICNLDCDVIEENGHLYIIDMNPRFGGGYPATHEAGVNLLELIIFMAKGDNIEPEFGNYRPGIFTLKEISVVATNSLVKKERENG